MASDSHSTSPNGRRRADRASLTDAPDFSLELSGGLDSDAHDGDGYDDLESIVHLDPEVLASLVIQLRTNLATAVHERNDIRGERDGLIGDLAVIQTRLQELEGAGEREVEYLNEMATWRKKCEDAEEQVGLLRAKVEESRRAVMTLQTQSRRLSQLSVPYTSSSPSPHSQTFGADAAAAPRTSAFQKRMSLQVGAGNTAGQAPPVINAAPKTRPHRRRSSVSDPEMGPSSNGSQSSRAPSSFPDSAASNRPVSAVSDQEQDSLSRRASRRHSAMIQRPTESLLNPMGAEMESLRQELIAVRMELMESKQELWEANEAKEASDVCMKALKEFIAENSIGDGTSPPGTSTIGSARGISLPPLPTDNIPDVNDDDEWSKTPVATHSNSGKRGWGLGFWNAGPTPAPGSQLHGPAVSPSPNVSSTSTKSSVPAPTSAPSPAPVGAISNFISKWRTSGTSSPSPSSSGTSTSTASGASSPQVRSPTASIGAAFSWNQFGKSNAPQTNTNMNTNRNDNYTPAPTAGNLKRRPSAYSTTGQAYFDIELNTAERRDSTTTIFDRRDSELYSHGMGRRDTMIGPLDAIASFGELHTSPSPLRGRFMDSTPSLTDADTFTTSSSEQESESPLSAEPKTPVSRQGSGSAGSGEPKISSVSRPGSTRSRSSTRGDVDLLPPPVPPLPSTPSQSPLLTEFAKKKASPSPSPRKPAFGEDVQGRKRTRSRAPSSAASHAGAAMETIAESGMERKTGSSQ